LLKKNKLQKIIFTQRIDNTVSFIAVSFLATALRHISNANTMNIHSQGRYPIYSHIQETHTAIGHQYWQHKAFNECWPCSETRVRSPYQRGTIT